MPDAVFVLRNYGYFWASLTDTTPLMKTISVLFSALSVTVGLLFASTLHAQSFDSVLVISPGLSRSVVAHGRLELGFFNQLSTEKSVFEFDTISETSRFSALYHVLQLGYGVDKHNRLNIGGIFIFGHTRSDLDENRSPFAVLGSGGTDATTFHKPAAVGVFARGIPFRSLPELTVQAGVLFPATGDQLARQFSGYDRTLAQLQLSFYQQFRPWFYLFATAETDVLFSNSTRKQTSVLLPLSLYPVFRLGYGSKTYLFGNLSYNGRFNKVKPGFLKSNGYRVWYGLGVQHYFTPDFSAYMQFQLPAAIESVSLTTTTPKAGAFIFALGGRWVF